MQEKLLTTIEFRCTFETKEQVEQLAAFLDITKSDFCRQAVEGKIAFHKNLHLRYQKRYQKVFGCWYYAVGHRRCGLV